MNDTTARNTRKNFSKFAFEIVEDEVEKADDAHIQHLVDQDHAGYESPRARAIKLRARMLQFHSIYNAAWHVRFAQHGRPLFRTDKIAEFVEVLRRDLEHCEDPEALIYAVADALTAYPRGLPWEG